MSTSLFRESLFLLFLNCCNLELLLPMCKLVIWFKSPVCSFVTIVYHGGVPTGSVDNRLLCSFNLCSFVLTFNSYLWQDATNPVTLLASGGIGETENGISAPPLKACIHHGERVRAMSTSGKVCHHSEPNLLMKCLHVDLCLNNVTSEVTMRCIYQSGSKRTSCLDLTSGLTSCAQVSQCGFVVQRSKLSKYFKIMINKLQTGQ